jgi:hypothetical protein
LFEKWSYSENGRTLAVPRIGRSENGRSENGRSEIGRSENGRCTKIRYKHMSVRLIAIIGNILADN